MGRWKAFLDSLASSGGTILCLILLTLLGYCMTMQRLPKGEDVLYLVLGAFIGILKSAHGKAE